MLTGYVCRGPNADNARDKKETFSGAIRLGATLKISCETIYVAIIWTGYQTSIVLFRIRTAAKM